MARAATSLSARLRQLDKAKARTSKLKRGETLTAFPMAKALGVSWNTLRKWTEEIEGFADAGCFEHGGRGVDYIFNPRKTVAFLTRHFKSQQKAQEKKSRDRSKAIGIKLPEEETPSMAETKDLVNLTVTMVQATERQGRYTRSDEVAEFIEGYNEAVASGILGVRTKIDPNGNLPPEVRKSMDEYLRSVAASVHAKAQKFVEEKRAGIQQAGVA